MEEESWRRNHEEESRRHLEASGEGLEASGRHLGSISVTYGSHLGVAGGIWEASWVIWDLWEPSGKHLGHLGSLWEPSGSNLGAI